LRGVLAVVWASPNTALGLAVGAVAVMLGSRAQVGRNAIEFLDNPFVGAMKRSGVTLGHTIHYAPGKSPDDVITRYDGTGRVRLGEHEEAHTRQYERWGPLFLLAYAISWVPGMARGGMSRFEHAADDWAETKIAMPKGIASGVRSKGANAASGTNAGNGANAASDGGSA
jgi:hypothetical protein